MTHFLWIEDFSGSDSAPQSTTQNLFGDLLGDIGNISNNLGVLCNQLKKHSIFLELNFYDGWQFIQHRLDEVDYIILDVDLPARGDEVDEDELYRLLHEWGYLLEQDYLKQNEEAINKAQNELRPFAGYHLYVKLIEEFGFPKDHILFCSNHAGELKSIEKAVGEAKMTWPNISTKSDSRPREWINEKSNQPYARLRRFILKARSDLKKEMAL